MGACCYYGICCPPGSPRAAAQLAEEIGIDPGAAKAVLEQFVILPRNMDKEVLDDVEQKLRAHMKARGIPTEEEDARNDNM